MKSRSECIINPKTGELYKRHLWTHPRQTPATYYVRVGGDMGVATWSMKRECKRCGAKDSWVM